MFDEEDLQIMSPKMSIDYRVENGFLTSGSFDNIPENAFGAHISTVFPVVNSEGKFEFSRDGYDLFVGEVFDVAGLLDESNKPAETNDVMVAVDGSKEKIKEYEKAGIKQVVFSTKIGIVPLRYKDAAFSSQEEMAQAITKINETFKSVNISLQNSETQQIHK